MINRRQVLKTATALGAFATIGGAFNKASASDTLRVLTWEGYADEQWVKEFEEKNSVKAAVSFVGGIDEIFARMEGSKGEDFDLIAIETSSYKRLVGQKLLSPIDTSKLANIGNLLPAFKDVEAIKFDGKPYAIPYAWGSIPLVYDQDHFPTAPDSWNVLWDPANAGKVITMDEANNNMIVAAIMLGIKDPFNLSDEQFEQVKQKLLALKKNLLSYYAGFDDGVTMFAQSGVTLMFSQGEPQAKMLKDRGVNAAFTIPKEGAIGWIDCWAISAAAKNQDLAHKWIDFMLDKRVGNYITTKVGYGNVADAAANDSVGFNYSDKLIWLAAPEDYQKRNNLWNEVKATPVP